jgi:hypothetical protein
MPVPGFDDPAVAALAAGGNLYYAADVGVASKIPAGPTIGLAPGQSSDNGPLNLMFGEGVATTGGGEPIVNAAQSTKGSFTEILNFHGSPAPWILIGILLAAGLLHLSAGAKFKGEL